MKLINWPLAASSGLLLSIGILVIYSTSTAQGIQQLIFAVLGILVFIFISQVDYRALTILVKPAYILIIILLGLVIFLGFESRGAVRWIPIGGLTIQPSEFAKPILIVLLAAFWTNRLPSWPRILKSALWIFPVLGLIFRQPDLGTALTVAATWLGMLFVAKISLKKALVLAAILLMVIPAGYSTLQQYQKQRIVSFLSPNTDPLGQGYNSIQSTIAVGSGKLFGRGLGLGTQSRLQFLPEFRTDFIFAAIAEELGFLGSVIILLIYLYLVWYILKVAESSPDYFGFLICCGVAVLILFQTVVNIGMNIGLLPVTGITLPLISYGGSSLLATMICLGLVASVAKTRDRVDIHRSDR